jgi:hypothetical protein
MSNCIGLDVLGLCPQRAATLLIFVQGKSDAHHADDGVVCFVLRDTGKSNESWHLDGGLT